MASFGRQIWPLLVVVASMIGCAAGERAASGEDEQAVRALIACAEQLNNANDAEGFAALFSRDAIIMPQGTRAIVGREAILASERWRNKQFTSEMSITPEEVIVAGEWAFARTAVSGRKIPGAGGEPILVDAKEIVIFRREGTSWRVFRLIGNTNGRSFAWHASPEVSEKN